MTVPEAPVDEENGPVFRKYQIRASWQLPVVQPETNTVSVKSTADQHFWLCVGTPDGRHIPAAGCLVMNISQL